MDVFLACLRTDFPFVFVKGELCWWERVICFLMGVEVVEICISNR